MGNAYPANPIEAPDGNPAPARSLRLPESMPRTGDSITRRQAVANVPAAPRTLAFDRLPPPLRNDHMVDAAAAGSVVLIVALGTGAFLHLNRGNDVKRRPGEAATAATFAALTPLPPISAAAAAPVRTTWNDSKHAGPITNARELQTPILWQRQIGSRPSALYASEALTGTRLPAQTSHENTATVPTARDFAAQHNARLARVSKSGADAQTPVSQRPLRPFLFRLGDAADDLSAAALRKIDTRGFSFEESDAVSPSGGVKSPYKAAQLFGDVDRFAVASNGHWVTLRYHQGAWRVVDGLLKGVGSAGPPPAVLENRLDTAASEPVTERNARGAVRALRAYLRGRFDTFTLHARTTPVHLAIPLGRA